VRGRVGYAIDRTLIYVTGGLAYANVKNAGTASIDPSTLSTETSGWRTGYAVGGGIETAIDKNWTIKFEGLYYNVGNTSVETSGYRFKSKNDGALARVGVNYKF
jgi:outer membrane immunogenic protein